MIHTKGRFVGSLLICLLMSCGEGEGEGESKDADKAKPVESDKDKVDDKKPVDEKKPDPKGGGEGTTETFTKLSNLSQIVGTWELASIKSESGAVASKNGVSFFTYMADSTFSTESTALSISIGSIQASNACTAYSNGKIQISSDNVISSDTLLIAISGKCHENFTGMSMYQEDKDNSYSVTVTPTKLRKRVNFSYNDLVKGPQTDAIIYEYNKVVTDTWDGNGLNPKYSGSWELEKVYYNSVCDTTEAGYSDLTLFGKRALSIQGTAYTATLTNFGFSAESACSGVESGTASKDGLKLKTTATATDACTAEEPDPPGYKVLRERDLVTHTGKIVSAMSTEEDSVDCPLGYVSAIISIYKKK